MLTIPGYTTIEQLYESGHSLIFRGRRNADNLPIVLKLLKNEYPTREEIARFKREYEITRNLNLSTGSGLAVDGVIGVYAMERYKGRLVMVLEDFGGESLTRYLGDQALEVTKFLRLAIQISDILGKIHQRNIMHKDINPSNIIWNPDTAQLKIIDFGISTELSREQPEIRNPNVLEGTLAYMSPEQTGRMNRAMDYRTDLYSLGATYYRLLTGQLPFQTTDVMELIHCHLAQHPVPLNKINQDIPKPVSDIIMKLLAKTAEDHYQGTFGLKADLQICLTQLQTSEGSETSKVFIEPFEIGQKDISDRFQIPQRLYGREQEIEILLEAFERVNTPLNPPSRGEGATELIAITGPPGIGKSSLVQEIHPAVVEKRGYFVSGKFEQLTQNIPYSAFIQAFRELIDYILAEPEIQINLWKERLLKALGANGRIIVEVIPEIELIIGPQPELPELSPDKAQNRFHLTFRNFVRTFATAEHPLVIFLDDTQWADLPSLKLITLFMTDTAISSLLLVCAYRNNESNVAHPLQTMLTEIQNTCATVNTITLKPLTLKDVNQLLVDTLHITHPYPSQEGEAPPYAPLKEGIPPDPSKGGSLLAELFLQKTGGNPFFLLQFLQLLHEERLLKFNDRLGIWEWKLEQIQKAEITDNVVNLMAGKIQKLPEATQRTLEFAACIGNQFDLETLATITEKAKTEIVYDVWKALQEGLIVQLDDSYSHVEIIDSYFPTTDLSESCLEGSREENRRIPVITGNPHFKFLHTRVRQAAYSLMAEDHKHTVHVKIGRLILDRTPKHELEEKIFEVVNHFNLGKDLITSQSEKDKLAEINLIAGKKAKASAAFRLKVNSVKGQHSGLLFPENLKSRGKEENSG
jgi:serine/threonine protein kinase